MPIHDWTRVRANRFHDFHQSWTICIRNALNSGLLPPGYFAMVEQKTGGPAPYVITLDLQGKLPRPGGIDILANPPRTRFVVRSEPPVMLAKPTALPYAILMVTSSP